MFLCNTITHCSLPQNFELVAACLTLSGTRKYEVEPTVNLSILSFPRIPPCISTVYWSFHFTVGGWRAEEGSLLWFTWSRVQSKTLSACGYLRQWKVHVFVDVLQASSCQPSTLHSMFSQKKTYNQ